LIFIEILTRPIVFVASRCDFWCETGAVIGASCATPSIDADGLREAAGNGVGWRSGDAPGDGREAAGTMVAGARYIRWKRAIDGEFVFAA
jgi:hypothetical protein